MQKGSETLHIHVCMSVYIHLYIYIYIYIQILYIYIYLRVCVIVIVYCYSKLYTVQCDILWYSSPLSYIIVCHGLISSMNQ